MLQSPRKHKIESIIQNKAQAKEKEKKNFYQERVKLISLNIRQLEDITKGGLNYQVIQTNE